MSGGERSAGSAPWATTAFAACFAYFEAACVAYLDRLQELGQLPWTATPWSNRILAIEVGREAVSLLLLATWAWLAGRELRERVAHFVLAFGIWDILYYVFLRLVTGWPTSLLDGDVLFLIPAPWYGPVATPVLCSLVMIAAGWGTVVLERSDRPVRPSGVEIVLGVTGCALVLFAFLSNAGARSPEEVKFPWGVFIAGWLAATAAVARILTRSAREG